MYLTENCIDRGAVVELWLDWLRDEIKYAEATDRPKVISLFERAVKDYMCEAIICVHCVYIS